MTQGSILDTLATNLHSFAAVAQTLKKWPNDIRKTLVEKAVHRLDGQISFCLCIWGITPIYADKITCQVIAIADALETLRKVNSANYSLQLGGKQQAFNDAHDEVDSALRELHATIQNLRSTALRFTTEAAINA